MDFTQIEQVEEKINEHSVLMSHVHDEPVDEEDIEEKQGWGTW